MPVMDEFREEREKIKTAPFKVKVKYFWDYYKVHTLATAAALALLIFGIVEIVNRTENALFVAVVNSLEYESEFTRSLTDSFTEYEELDTKKYSVNIDNSMNIVSNPTTEIDMYAPQKMMVYTSSGDLDIIISDNECFEAYANQGLFTDLRTVFTEKEIADFGDSLFYIDDSYIELINSEEYAYSTVLPPAPNPTKPEEMEKPVPVGFILKEDNLINKSYFFTQGAYTVTGITLGSSHIDASKDFIRYIHSR